MVNLPFISPDSVHAALDSLLYSTSNKETHLLYLLLVDEFLTQPDLPHSSLSREFALSHILTSLITSEFKRQRSISGYYLPEPDADKQIIYEMIRYDAEITSPELIGWSWLYHHYVRIELAIHPHLFCDLSHIEDRTLRRYQRHIIKRLSNLLIEQEWLARIRRRDRRLLSELPRSSNFMPLIARDESIDYVNRRIIDTKPAHFYVSGARGVGKTTFVEAVVGDQIKKGVVDQLVWIQRPLSTQYVYSYLTERFALTETHIGLREYLLLYRTIVVLDDADALFNELPHLRNLLNDMSSATVFVINSGIYSLLSDTIEVVLREFDLSETQTFTSQLLASAQYPLRINNELIANIWYKVGGNPLALQLLIRNLPYFDLKTVSDLLQLNTVYDRIFQLVEEDSRLAWVILTLMPHAGITFNHLVDLWKDYISVSALGRLLRYHIVEYSSDHYVLTNGARHYIENKYQQDARLLRMVDHLLMYFDNCESSDNPEFYLVYLEYLLLAEWIDLNSKLREKWITNWWPEGRRLKHWATWRTLITLQVEAGTVDIRIFKAYVVCLQNLGEWVLARKFAEKVIAETGKKGLFNEQFEAQIQLSVILRHLGEYELVLEILTRIEKVATQRGLKTLLTTLVIEYIHLAIDLGDSQFAQNYAGFLPDNFQGYSLRSEIYFLEADYVQARIYADLALSLLQNDFLSRARIYTLVGRICEQENNVAGAQENFSWALMILEKQDDDMFAFSRAQLNLGALFLRIGHYEEASLLLNAAEKIQLHLGNRITLAAIQHNLGLLDIALSEQNSLQ